MTDAALTLIPSTARKLFCVYEHHLPGIDGNPPQLIYVGSCRLIDVYQCSDAMNNSDWHSITQAGAVAVIVRIIHLDADKAAARAIAIRHVRSLPVMPRCNLHGFSMNGASRPLIASNGRTYANQREAAADIGVTQAAISHHMAGRLAAVKGVTLAYALSGEA